MTTVRKCERGDWTWYVDTATDDVLVCGSQADAVRRAVLASGYVIEGEADPACVADVSTDGAGRVP